MFVYFWNSFDFQFNFALQTRKRERNSLGNIKQQHSSALTLHYIKWQFDSLRVWDDDDKNIPIHGEIFTSPDDDFSSNKSHFISPLVAFPEKIFLWALSLCAVYVARFHAVFSFHLSRLGLPVASFLRIHPSDAGQHCTLCANTLRHNLNINSRTTSLLNDFIMLDESRDEAEKQQHYTQTDCANEKDKNEKIF